MTGVMMNCLRHGLRARDHLRKRHERDEWGKVDDEWGQASAQTCPDVPRNAPELEAIRCHIFNLSLRKRPCRFPRVYGVVVMENSMRHQAEKMLHEIYLVLLVQNSPW